MADTDALLMGPEIANLQGQDELSLIVCSRYLETLLHNDGISEYLEHHHHRIARQLRSLVDAFRNDLRSEARKL